MFNLKEAIHMQVTTIGLDLAKSVFQVHGVDAAGEVVITRKLRRAQVLAFFAKLAPCLVGMEACGSAHHWARELMALGLVRHGKLRCSFLADSNASIRRRRESGSQPARAISRLTRSGT